MAEKVRTRERKRPPERKFIPSPPKDLPYVVVQFTEAFLRETRIRYEDGQEDALGEFWKRVTEGIAGARLRPLFRSLSRGQLQSLNERRACRRKPAGLCACLKALFDVKALFGGAGHGSGYRVPNLFAYYQIVGGQETKFGELAARLRQARPQVRTAYVEQPAPLPNVVYNTEPAWPWSESHFQDSPPGPGDNPPGGIDALWAWDTYLATGSGVKIVDLERGWLFEHEDLELPESSTLVAGINERAWRHHGTAVLGLLCGKDGNGLGGVGAAPRAIVRTVSVVESIDPVKGPQVNIPDALTTAIAQLGPGDILLIQHQVYESEGSTTWLPIEVNQANYDLIRGATQLGITVIEAGGNGGLAGGVDFDGWEDPVSREHLLARPAIPSRPDSGAIIVSAAHSDFDETGTIRRPGYAPYGRRVDCFAWGHGVFTCWADGNQPPAKNLYVPGPEFNPPGFGGTSAAAALVAGAALLLQDAAWHRNGGLGPPIGAPDMRRILGDQTLNTPPPASDLIGAMPNLRRLLDALKNNPGSLGL